MSAQSAFSVHSCNCVPWAKGTEMKFPSPASHFLLREADKSRTKHNTMSAYSKNFQSWKYGLLRAFWDHAFYELIIHLKQVEEIKGSQFWDLDTPGKSLVQDQGETCRLFGSWIHAQGLGVSFLGGVVLGSPNAAFSTRMSRGPVQLRGHFLSGIELRRFTWLSATQIVFDFQPFLSSSRAKDSLLSA